jgi:signal transduction histidine kinase
MQSPHSANGVSLLLAGGNATFQAVARDAGQLAFPGGSLRTVSHSDEALRTTGSSGLQLAILAEPGEAARKLAAAVDDQGLPRWGVVVCGLENAGGDIAVVAPADWTVPLVAQVFRSAAMQQRLRRENARLREDLLSIATRVAHDLRSPLGGVLTSAELLKEVLATDAPDSSALVDPVIESVDGLMKLIRQLSLIAKASARPGARTRVNMGAPIWAATQKLERRMTAQGVDFKPAELWPDVIGDTAWLEAIWQALLANAIEHAGAAPRIEAGWDRAEGGHRFWVRDDGAVPPDKRETLFPHFHRLHQPNAPRGLGLAIVRRLVEAMDGRCGYEPVSEKGSCFYFTLPAAE